MVTKKKERGDARYGLLSFGLLSLFSPVVLARHPQAVLGEAVEAEEPRDDKDEGKAEAEAASRLIPRARARGGQGRPRASEHDATIKEAQNDEQQPGQGQEGPDEARAVDGVEPDAQHDAALREPAAAAGLAASVGRRELDVPDFPLDGTPLALVVLSNPGACGRRFERGVRSNVRFGSITRLNCIIRCPLRMG